MKLHEMLDETSSLVFKDDPDAKLKLLCKFIEHLCRENRVDLQRSYESFIYSGMWEE